ncbi:DNA primase family protein [Mycobacterium ahvazicum]|uniref:DNA primase family protein n=1 Tax=Mycobacterium ahvazicum TaxID=1964395 RepID=UPI0013FDBA25|nr:phage/plasmid primase, P4 family [Mycobacterium ahvazicum]
MILRLVHTDGDKGLDQEKIDRLADLGAFVIGSGSPGNGHVYVPLNEEVSQVAHIALCRGLIEYLDGDKAKHSDNDLLRPVGGYNFKSTVFEGLPARQVQWLIKPNGTRVDPHTLAALLGVDLAAAEERAKTNGRANKEKARITGTARVISQHHAEDPKPIDLERYPKVGEALAEVSEPPDRSRDLHRVVRAVYDANLTEAHAVWAVQQRDDLADRLSEHPDDVARSWSKIDVEQRLAHTDKGNATQLVAEYSPGIRYVPEIGKWMHWNGVLWHFDPDTGTIDTAAGQIATELPGATKRDRSHRKRSLSAAGIGAMVRLARSDPAMRCSRDRLDASGWQLNTLSGIVNLRTGEICDHHPDAWHTKITGVGYDPEGDCPRWTEFLRTTFEGDEELIAYVQGLCGYAAIGKVLANILPFFWGAGQNGKTVLLEVISRVLGDYAIAAPANFLLAGRDKHETEIARLAGARFVVCSEINQGTRFDEAKVKVLTGGDTLTGRFMHGNFFDFSPSHMLILVGNHQPAVGAGGYAFWRRVRLVPFTHQVPEDKRNKHLADELVAAEGPAILGWIARGAATVASDELVTPERVMTATEEYEESEDRTKQFLDDCTTRGTGEDRELVGDVYQRYIEWCHANRFKDPLESRVFAREIYSRGYQKAKSNGKRYIHGLKLTRQTWDRQQQ